MSFIGAAIAAAAAIGGSIISADASRSAANKQADAAQNAQQLQLDMFNRNKQDLAPWMQSGQKGNEALMNFLGLGGGGFDPNAPGVRPFGAQDFQQDPGYQFRMNEGLNAVLNKRSAIGGLDSGNTMRALEDYGQGMASQEYQNAFNRYNTGIGNIYTRLSGISNSGLNAAGGIAGLGANAGARAGDFGVQGGNALAAGTVGQANAVTGGINDLMGQWLRANQIQQGGGNPAMPNFGLNDPNSLGGTYGY